MKTPCFLNRIWSFNGTENGVWCRLNVAVLKYWFGFGYYGSCDEIWFVFVMLLIFHSIKFGKRYWWFDWKLLSKSIEIIIFKFQICRTNICWDNRCFMLWGFYQLWFEPYLVITMIPVFLILHRWKTNDLVYCKVSMIVNMLWMYIYSPVFPAAIKPVSRNRVSYFPVSSLYESMQNTIDMFGI